MLAGSLRVAWATDTNLRLMSVQVYAGAPAMTPLPTCSNFPFQPESGIQISALMSESVDGLIVAATRQNAGRSAKACAAPGPPPRPAGAAGGTNCPAATGCADVMVVFDS